MHCIRPLFHFHLLPACSSALVIPSILLEPDKEKANTSLRKKSLILKRFFVKSKIELIFVVFWGITCCGSGKMGRIPSEVVSTVTLYDRWNIPGEQYADWVFPCHHLVADIVRFIVHTLLL